MLAVVAAATVVVVVVVRDIMIGVVSGDGFRWIGMSEVVCRPAFGRTGSSCSSSETKAVKIESITLRHRKKKKWTVVT